MSTSAPYSTFEESLHQRDTEIQALRAELAAVKAALPPGIASPGAFLRQVQQVFAGMLHTDPQGRIVWANAAFLERCHCTLPELLGRSVAHLSPGMEPDPALAADVRAGLTRGEAFQLDIPDPRPRNERDWLRLKMQPIFGENHSVDLFVGLLEDISVKRRAQLALAETEAEFQVLAAQVPCVLYRVRPGSTDMPEFLSWSQRLHELFGLESMDSICQYIHADDRQRLLRAMARAHKTGAPMRADFRLLVPGQPLRWCRTSSMLTGCDEQGVVRSGSLEDITLERHAEERERQSKLRAVQVHEGLGCWEYHYDTKITVFSPECRTMMGYPDDYVSDANLSLQDHVHPEDKPVLDEAWARYHRGDDELFFCEYRLRCHDDRYIWVVNRGMITERDPQGQPLIFTGFCGDISIRRNAQMALDRMTRRLTTTIKKLKRGVLLVDEDRKVVLTNASFCKLFGLAQEPEDFIGVEYDLIEAQVQAAIAGSLHGDALPEMATLVAQRQDVRHDLLRLRNGRVVERDFVAVEEHGRDIGFLWKFEDITESYNAETNLRLREERYRTIIDNMQLGLVELDLDRRVLYANPNYCSTLGYTSDELIGRQLPVRLLPPESQVFLQQQYQKQDQGISSSYEMAIVTKTGETKWLFCGGAPLYDQNRHLAGSIGISFDISSQKQMEQSLREAMRQAEQSARVKELFLANMSHEIRTPMNAILGMSQLLAKTPLAPKQSNYLHAISTSAQNLLVIVNDILDLSKLDAGHMTIERVGFNVNRLCEQVKKNLLYKAEEKGLALMVRVNPLVPDVVLGDPYRITQILLNLASNAVKFTEKGEVSIECEVVHFHQGTVELSFVVRDTGIGIAAENLQRIFQEFSQEDPSITRQFGGTGLGLSICRSLARLMDGEIGIESVKNQGTVTSFTLELPTGTVDDLPHRGLVSSANLQELRGKHVLVVEDNEYNRLMAKTFLLNAHLNVTEAENGQEALDRLGEQAFDLVLMDVQMPVMDGFEATRRLRQDRGLTLPIIALTASAISGEKERCLAAGMDDYLTKPFYEDELLQLLCDWLLKPEARNRLSAPPAPEAAPPAKLYDLSVLLSMARGDEKFVSSMLQTFIKSTQRTLQDLHGALAVGNMEGLQAAAHKLRPSLRHLQIGGALELMDALDNWPGPFSYDDLQPQVETADRILRQVLVEMNDELEKRAAAGY